MAWNTPWAAESVHPRSVVRANSTVKATAATASTAAVTTAITLTRRLTSPSDTCPASVRACMRNRTPNRRDKNSATSEPSVMIPNPPIWMSTRITTWPNGDQWVAVSTTTRPVTHTALVAVNTASSSDVDRPGVCDTGSINNALPITMRVTKASTTTRAG